MGSSGNKGDRRVGEGGGGHDVRESWGVLRAKVQRVPSYSEERSWARVSEEREILRSSVRREREVGSS